MQVRAGPLSVDPSRCSELIYKADNMFVCASATMCDPRSQSPENFPGHPREQSQAKWSLIQAVCASRGIGSPIKAGSGAVCEIIHSRPATASSEYIHAPCMENKPATSDRTNMQVNIRDSNKHHAPPHPARSFHAYASIKLSSWSFPWALESSPLSFVSLVALPLPLRSPADRW